MKMPWTTKTGLAKTATILATILLISLGLCGANFFAVIRFVPLAGPAPPPGTQTWPETLLTITAEIEVAAICLSVCGLVLVALAYSARAMPPRRTRDKNEVQGQAKERGMRIDLKQSDSSDSSTVPKDRD
jgi:hypothetical protein